MIEPKSNAKALHSFPLKDFGGGINTDTPGTDTELVQCLNAILDSKGIPETRGGSKCLNVDAPIGYQEKEVWGYLFGCDEDENEYTSSFLTGGAIAASAYNGDAAKTVDGLPATYWQAKDLYAWSESYDSAATTINCQAFFLGKLYVGANNGNIYVFDGTTWSLSYDSIYSSVTSLCVFNGKLFAGYYYNSTYINIDVTSDGVNWGIASRQNIGLPWLTYINSMVVQGSYIYISVTQYQVLRSLDGYTWSFTAAQDGPGDGGMWGSVTSQLVSFAGSLYRIFTDATYKHIRKFSGTSWSTVYTATDALYCGYSWDSKLYIGDINGKIFASANGADYTEVEDLGDNTITAFVEYGTKLLVAYGSVIYETSNGTDWTEFYSAASTIYTMIVFKWTVFHDDSLFIGIGTTGKVLAYENTVSYTDGWLKYTLAATKTARKLTITPYNSGVRLFTLYGSNDDITYTSIYSSICDAGNVKQEFTFANATAYLYYKLMINTAYGSYFISVNEWELMELTASTDMNYYIFNKIAKDIIRKVVFPTLNSMLSFVTYWKAKNLNWADTYYCTASDFDITDNGDVSEKVIAEGEFTIDNFSEAILDGKINEWMSVFSLLKEEENNAMFGIPQAWKITLENMGATSMHELKRRDLKQTYSYDEATGIFSNADLEPKQYIQNKFVFVTADNALLTANIADDLIISGFNVLGTGLKRGAKPSWDNFQNRAFMVNGCEDDCNLIWTDGEEVYRIGLVAPTEIPIFSSSPTTGGFMSDGTYYFKYAYHRTTHGTNDSNFSPELAVTLAGEITLTGSIDTTASTSVVGVGTLFTTELEVGDKIKVNEEIRTVDLITDNTHLRVTFAFTDMANDTDPKKVDLDTQCVILTVNPSSDPQVDKIYLYRSKVNDYLFYKCAEIDNVYDANDAGAVLPITALVNDNSMGVGSLASDDNDLPPNAKFFTIGGDRAWYATNSGVYYSKKGFPEKVPIENYIPVNEDDGELVMGMRVTTTWLIVGKETKMFAIDVNNPDSLNAILISDTLGIVDNKTFQTIEGELAIWVSQLGPCVSDGVSVVLITKGRQNNEGLIIGKIFNDFVNNYDHTRKEETFGIYYPKRQQYWCHVPYVGGYNRLWIYDIQKKIFYKNTFPIEPENFFLLTDSDNVQQLISTFTQIETAKYYGYFVLYDDETDLRDVSAVTLARVETKTDIPMDIITVWNCFGLAERIKSFRMIYTEMYASAATTATISCGIDYKRMERVEVALSGSIDTTASVNVVGVGTCFLTQLIVGDSIVVGTETRVVATITDNTHLTVTVAFSNQPNDTSPVKLAPGIHSATITHPGEVGTAPTAGKDEVEGYDFGRTRSIPSPVDGVGTYYSIRFQHTGHVKVKLFGFTIMFRLRGARP